MNRQEIIDVVFLGQGKPSQTAPRPESKYYHERLATQYLEFSNDKLMGRVQRAEQARVHHILVVGQKEQNTQAIAVRLHGRGQQGTRPRAEVVADILVGIKERRA